ncbi:MAG: Na+/H+ antiporter NhaA, partial [Mucinivorans sp.]
ALIYVSFNEGTPSAHGWGIPMATDIAFALGVLSMFSSRVPLSLKVFLTALAIVDDLGAILVIAIFYSSSINFVMLGCAALIFIYLMLLNHYNVYKMRMYLIPAIVLWFLFLNSGVHATIAGVLIAMTMPSSSKFTKAQFIQRSAELLSIFKKSEQGLELINNETQHQALQELRVISRNTISPIQRLEHALHSSVNFFIMPIFALANAGVVIAMTDLPALLDNQGLGIELGLIIGKPIGIVLFSWIIIKMGLSQMPQGATWPKLIGVGCLGGIGFTMSIFIDMLAFSDPTMVSYGKMAILTASVIAGIVGSVVLMNTKKVESRYHW